MFFEIKVSKPIFEKNKNYIYIHLEEEKKDSL